MEFHLTDHERQTRVYL